MLRITDIVNFIVAVYSKSDTGRFFTPRFYCPVFMPGDDDRYDVRDAQKRQEPK
jgi:hypothetical protein